MLTASERMSAETFENFNIVRDSEHWTAAWNALKAYIISHSLGDGTDMAQHHDADSDGSRPLIPI